MASYRVIALVEDRNRILELDSWLRIYFCH